MLRVAYLFERFPSFGQTFCYREVAELIRQGADVSIFSIRRPKDEPAQDWDPGIVKRVVYLPEEADLIKEVNRAVRRRELPDAALRALREWGRQPDFLRLYDAAFVGMHLQKAGITRLHVHFAGMAARAAFWIRECFGIAFSVTAHANDIFAPRKFVVSLEKIFDRAAAVVTVSDFSRQQLCARYPNCAGKIVRVYNGIDPAVSERAQFTSQPPAVLSVGRLIEKKGFATLIAACAELKHRDVQFNCEIIGDGPLEPSLRAQISAGSLEREVQLLGPRSQAEIRQRLAAANLFVLACTMEPDGGMDNLPTVIMEAMAASLPVVSTPLAGVPEMVEPGVTGELVPPRDPHALANAMADLLNAPERAREFGHSGRVLAEEKFAVEANVHALAAILQCA